MKNTGYRISYVEDRRFGIENVSIIHLLTPIPEVIGSLGIKLLNISKLYIHESMYDHVGMIGDYLFISEELNFEVSRVKKSPMGVVLKPSRVWLTTLIFKSSINQKS